MNKISINRHAWLEIDKFTGRVRWCYRAIYHDRAVICRMNQLCEVGEKYQQQFRDWLSGKGYAIYRLNVPEGHFLGDKGDYYEILYGKIPF